MFGLRLGQNLAAVSRLQRGENAVTVPSSSGTTRTTLSTAGVLELGATITVTFRPHCFHLNTTRTCYVRSTQLKTKHCLNENYKMIFIYFLFQYISFYGFCNVSIGKISTFIHTQFEVCFLITKNGYIYCNKSWLLLFLTF